MQSALALPLPLPCPSLVPQVVALTHLVEVIVSVRDLEPASGDVQMQRELHCIHLLALVWRQVHKLGGMRERLVIPRRRRPELRDIHGALEELGAFILVLGHKPHTIRELELTCGKRERERGGEGPSASDRQAIKGTPISSISSVSSVSSSLVNLVSDRQAIKGTPISEPELTSVVIVNLVNLVNLAIKGTPISEHELTSVVILILARRSALRGRLHRRRLERRLLRRLIRRDRLIVARRRGRGRRSELGEFRRELVRARALAFVGVQPLLSSIEQWREHRTVDLATVLTPREASHLEHRPFEAVTRRGLGRRALVQLRQ